MENINQFQYIYDNINIYQFQFTQYDWIVFASVLIGGIALLVFLYQAIRYIALYTKSWNAAGALARKKRVLGDLILMKDIQTELEKEIEQAVLKAAFRS